MPRSIIVPPGGGTGYRWSLDHTFIKVASAETDGAFTLVEDNMSPGFSLGLHLHRTHSETFYVLEGPLWFYLTDRWHAANAGTTIHVPPGTPHAFELQQGQSGRMLMLYQPGGFDRFLAEMAAFTDADFADETKMHAFHERHDNIILGDVPPRPED